ncbi:MAG: hypothetical protein QOE77_3670 [Blastocatellia bacterium]|jgi:hypothetical protein|nr:hypothetical protein [Blastocatellia bacterium]
MITKTFVRCAVLCGIFFIANGSTLGQSTVFNIPSTDVTPAERTYVEADFLTHLDSYERGGYQLYGGRLVYGLRRHTEIGINVYYTWSGGSPEPIVIEPNMKWQFYNDEGKGLSAAAGVVVSVPISHRSTSIASGFMYAVGSKKFGGTFGPRISTGMYVLAPRAEAKAGKYGTLIGYEQPLNQRVTFIADWNSGKNDLGYLAAGIGISLTPKSALYLGYNVGNEGRSNNALGIYYGVAF